MYSFCLGWLWLVLSSIIKTASRHHSPEKLEQTKVRRLLIPVVNLIHRLVFTAAQIADEKRAGGINSTSSL
ncbi:unnamed protein product [Lactuca virosa]|uniref:Secreted protein n=1 Tax=Lactuca virosa TaxID=75947 RepID=A0AAU9MHV9_9ASTR|nr:unnamed protein product [Lactuca virosa]